MSLAQRCGLRAPSDFQLENLTERQSHYPPLRIEEARLKGQWRDTFGISHRLTSVEEIVGVEGYPRILGPRRVLHHPTEIDENPRT